MITEHHQELASLYALGALDAAEPRAFETELLVNPELRRLSANCNAPRTSWLWHPRKSRFLLRSGKK